MNWQPIETAPRDGMRILAYYQAFAECRQAVIYWDDEFDGWMIGVDRYISRPTHWMPLPPAPKEGE